MASSSSDSRSKPFQTLTTASSTVPLRHGAPDAEGPSEQDAQADEKQDWRFWAVFASLSLTSFVCALNQGVLIPAMPSIVHELGGTYDYIWAFTSYNLAHAREVFSRMDWRGNAIFVAACVSSVLALGWAGTIHPWGSIEVLLPLLLGLAGFAGFVVYEAFAPFPMLPPHMFRNRNFVASWTMSFASGLVSTMLGFFMVYLQGVLASSPAEAGVQYLPAVFATTFSALAGGQLLSKTGDYKSIHIVCAAIQTAGAGLMSTLDERSPTAMWVVFRMIAGIGPGALGATVLPAAQAALSPSDVAKSAAALAFGQSLGSLWGLAVPAAVFNGRAQQLAHRVQDPIASRQLSGGQAYSRATKAFLDSLSVERGTRAQTVGVFVDSLRLVWYTQIGLSALCFMQRTWRLSVLDNLYGTGYVSCYFCFPLAGPTAKDTAVERIKKGLEATLATFPILGGILTTIHDADGRPQTAVQRQADVSDVFKAGILVVDEIERSVFPYSYEQWREAGFPIKELPGDRLSRASADTSKPAPVCVIKLNFIEGGLVLAIIVERAVLDGSSATAALNHIARHTWNGAEAPTTTDNDGSAPPRIFLPARLDGDKAVPDCLPEFNFDSSVPVFTGCPRSTGRVFSFASATLVALKAAVMEHMRAAGQPGWVSTNNCLNALIWLGVLRARARRLGDNATAKFAAAVDLRGRVDPPVPHEYLRNTVLFALAQTRLSSFPDRGLAGSIANITHAAMAVRAAIDAVDSSFVRERVAFLGSKLGGCGPREVALAALRAMDVGHTGLFLSSAAAFMSGASFDLDASGRGQCAEATRKPYVGFPGTLFVLPGAARCVDVMVELEEDEMESFAQDEFLGAYVQRVVD
ncbi:Transferase [Macrophomina phaseolina MS6]|uniref:Transferase n=1 Tax=Macrophomina phaseolina (strain MS6) TaxID=1126212 RepID=K2S3K1_MACPH|nr:Transferase [Macrophomina phaseolina MS6]